MDTPTRTRIQTKPKTQTKTIHTRHNTITKIQSTPQPEKKNATTNQRHRLPRHGKLDQRTNNTHDHNLRKTRIQQEKPHRTLQESIMPIQPNHRQLHKLPGNTQQTPHKENTLALLVTVSFNYIEKELFLN